MTALRDVFARWSRVVVAYSGGVDSSVVLDAAVEALGARAVGVIALSETLTQEEYAQATEQAIARGWPIASVRYSELAIPGYAENPANRCFHCKDALYERLVPIARRLNAEAVLDGTTTSDLGDFRPGLDAARGHGVQSPLVMAGLAKQAVRAEAQRRGLRVWDKPSAPCLSSRIPYGETITHERLSQVARAEAALRAEGFREVRVRHHDTIARIEVPVSELPLLLEEPRRARILEALREIGFTYITMDLAGFRSGSMNEPLKLKNVVSVSDLLESLK